MTVTVQSDSLLELLDPEAELEQLAEGFSFSEGPAWHPVEQRLYFSDVVGSVRYRWSEADGLEELHKPSDHSNGSAFAPDLTHVVCEHETARVVAYRPDGSYEVLASHWQGRQLNSPNDVCVRSDGTLWFSDPPFGRDGVAGPERDQELDVQGLFSVRPDGELLLARDDFGGPNGVCLSPDESILYVNDTARAHVRAFDVAADGTLSGDRLFAEGIGEATLAGGIVDGMKCDVHGNLWVTGPRGIWVFSPAGEHLGVLEVPQPNVGNFAWGGPDWTDLYVCATAALYRVPTKVAGHRLAFPG
jgi:gluconolactonase